MPRKADYWLMRCLYCGKELALLKRLTGGGDFCSDAHKQSYQEEYNRLALSRLLQAQKKGQQNSNAPGPDASAPPKASVALQEPSPRLEKDDRSAVPALEEALAETRTLAKPVVAPDAVTLEESSPESVIEAEIVGAEPEPREGAGFLLESPAPAALMEQTPYLESWLELSSGPAMSEWQFDNSTFSLPPTDLLSLDLRPNASVIVNQNFPAGLTPLAFANPQPDPALSAAGTKKIANANRLPATGASAIDIAPSFGASATDQSLTKAIGFESTVLFGDSRILELSPTAIDFPKDDSDIVVPAGSDLSTSAFVHPGTDSETELETTAEGDSPQASLEALSRLHQELVEQETTQTEAAPSESPTGPAEGAPVEFGETALFEVSAPEAVPHEGQEARESTEIAIEEPRPEEELGPGAEAWEPAAEALEPAAEPPRSRFATELFEISIRTFPPAKPALIGGNAFPSHVAPLLPHLKSLPLRPRIALAVGYAPPSAAPVPSDAKPAPPAATGVRTAGPSKPASAGKPVARLVQPKQPNPSIKPVPATVSKATEPRAPGSTKTIAPKADPTTRQAKPAAPQPIPVQESSAARANLSEAPSKTAPVENGQGSAPAKDTAKRVAGSPRPPAGTGKPLAEPAKPPADDAKIDDVPNFGIAQRANSPWLGSLKVKLALAIVLLVIACVYFLGWGGGKSNKPATSNPAVSADGAGPSIIMGEGGWVEGWAGDPAGLHAGRQITIYRPSLKLSDYRLEFQGTVDVKSLGWVFRASDPDDYYAMKLTVTSGLSSKVALFKYLVANGKQTQVGRVPIDLAVQPDTAFNVRLDVRGPQFTTYIQGQQVDSWTDDQLKIGGVGFLNEREERGKVKSVSIRYLSGPAK